MRMIDEREKINEQGDAEQIEANVNETTEQLDATGKPADETKNGKKAAGKHTQ